MTSKAATVAEYLKSLPDDRRSAIEAVRKVILAVLQSVLSKSAAARAWLRVVVALALPRWSLLATQTVRLEWVKSAEPPIKPGKTGASLLRQISECFREATGLSSGV